MASGSKKKGPKHRRRKPSSYNTSDRCRTGKYRFNSMEHAREALLRVDQTRMHQPTRIYPCDDCEGYHFTSKNYLRSGGPGRRR